MNTPSMGGFGKENNSMTKFLIRRIFLAFIIFFFGMLITYSVIRALPTSYVDKMILEKTAGKQSVKSADEWREQLNKVYGLDKGIIPGYLTWLGNAVRGNFGDSWLWNVSCIEKFGDVIGYSFFLNVITLLVQFLIGIPLGILAARRQYGAADYTITVFALACISLPTFFLATIFKYLFAVKLGWLPLYGLKGSEYYMHGFWYKFWDLTRHLIMPVVTLTMLSIGGIMRYTRTNMLEVMNSDYIRTARAKGLPEKKVINIHAFRNTLIPLISLMSGILPSMFGGAMITETMYKIPGIGYISYQSIIQGDIPFAMFYTAFILILTLASIILTDILYAVVDPRVRVN